PEDTAPSFAGTVADQTYTVGEAISTLIFPAASGGNGVLSYSLTPSVLGLTFTPSARTLSGTPITAGTYAMTYRVVDSDDDAAVLRFTIEVGEPEPTDTAPMFVDQHMFDQSYVTGTPIDPLRLSVAVGGNGTPLTYSLDPVPPGLTFDKGTRTLSGTPTVAGTYHLVYQAHDADTNESESDAATLSFTITVLDGSRYCPDHSATRIVGDWDTYDNFGSDLGIHSFRADGTYLINFRDTGRYAYDADTCTIAWEGIVKRLVYWYNADLFCTRFRSAPDGFCLKTFTREQ
ncbi:MAG: Ig domain-containing protein, partial [bacterium]|nr:Ig domain-containing protein [bacterium]